MYARFKNINIFNILTTMISNVFVFPFSKRIAISIKSKSNFETFHLSRDQKTYYFLWKWIFIEFRNLSYVA